MANKQLILIGFAEALAGPESAWSLVDAGFEVVAFSRSGVNAALRKSTVVQLASVTPPETDADASLAELVDLIERLAPAAVLALDDAAVWLVARAAEATDVRVVGPTGALSEFAIDKRIQFVAAEAAGFAVPATEITEAGLLGEGLTYPSYIRPALAVELHGSRLTKGRGGPCADERDIRELQKNVDVSSPFVVQPLIRGAGGGLFGLAGRGGVGALSAHRRVRMVSPAGSGSSACAPARVPSELVEPTERLISSLRWRGMFMIEYLIDADGLPWFIEFNGRPWGSTALARDLGLEYPAWAAMQLLVDPGFMPEIRPLEQDFLCRHLGRELVHLARVLRGPPRAATEWPSKGQALRGVMSLSRTDRWYNYRRGEERVLVADTYQTLRQLLKR